MMHQGLLARRGVWIAALLAVYALIALMPVVLAALQGLRPRPFWDEFSSAIAMAGFAMLLMEFVLSGRFRVVSGSIGIDSTMRFHQLIARVLTVMLLIHPFLYTLPMSGRGPVNPDSALFLGLTPAGTVSGLLAWVGLAGVTAIAILREKMEINYEFWRLSHGLGAAAIAMFGLHHTLDIGRYTGDGYSTAYWIIAAVVAFAALLVVYVIRPLRQRSRPYHVTQVASSAERTWTVRIEPDHEPRRFNFAAGQFAWLKFTQPLWRITEHPFSISSSPAQLPALEFMIKESGDFTRQIGQLAAGTAAYVDGPHGNFTLHGRSGKGLVLIAGGVGFAPILSILRQLVADGDRRPVILIYGNRIAEQIACRDELGALQQQQAIDLKVFFVLSEPAAGWDGLVGQLDAPVLEQCLPEMERNQWLYLVCGPTAMIDSVEEALARAGVPLAQIVAERFRYDTGGLTVREMFMLGICAMITLLILSGAILFTLR